MKKTEFLFEFSRIEDNLFTGHAREDTHINKFFLVVNPLMSWYAPNSIFFKNGLADF